MKNFNTNQARHLYVAKTLVGKNASIANPGDIKQVGIDDLDMVAFEYVNGDGIKTRTDLIEVRKMEYITAVNAPDIPLNKATVTLATGITPANDLLGKHVQLTVTLRDFHGLGFGESYPITVDVYGDSTNTASATTFYKALEDELKAAVAGFAAAPFDVTSSASGLVITEKQQPFVFGKHSADPIHFDVTCHPVDELAWGSIAVAASGTSVNGSYALSDLEYFTHYERSESLREKVFPYNYTWTPLIVPADNANYCILTIQYYYSGNAEDVQKSPKTMHIVGSYSVISSIINVLSPLNNAPRIYNTMTEPADDTSNS